MPVSTTATAPAPACTRQAPEQDVARGPVGAGVGVRGRGHSVPAVPRARWAPSGATQMPGAGPAPVRRRSSRPQGHLAVQPPREALERSPSTMCWTTRIGMREGRGNLGEDGGERLRAARRGGDPDDRGGAVEGPRGAGARWPCPRPARGWRITGMPARTFTRRRKSHRALAVRIEEVEAVLGNRVESPGSERGAGRRRPRLDAPREGEDRDGPDAHDLLDRLHRPTCPAARGPSSRGRAWARAATAGRSPSRRSRTRRPPRSRGRARAAGRARWRRSGESSQMRTRRTGARAGPHRPTSRSTVSSRSCWSKLRFTM